MKITFTFLVFICFAGIQAVVAQQNTSKTSDVELIQFTGFVVNADSTKTLPFVSIRIKGTSRGAYSDMQGYFSFVAKKTDVILFSSIGFVSRTFVFPANLNGSKLNTVVTMTEDTFYLPDYIYRANPTPEELDYAFSRTNIPMDEYTLAQQNLRKKPLMDMAAGLANDGIDNSRWTFNNYANKAYYAGQAQPIPVLDVFAWNKFIKSLSDGTYKRK